MAFEGGKRYDGVMFSLLRKSLKSTSSRKPALTQRTVEVGGRHVPITIKENQRATRITLRIEPGEFPQPDCRSTACASGTGRCP